MACLQLTAGPGCCWGHQVRLARGPDGGLPRLAARGGVRCSQLHAAPEPDMSEPSPLTALSLCTVTGCPLGDMATWHAGPPNPAHLATVLVADPPAEASPRTKQRRWLLECATEIWEKFSAAFLQLWSEQGRGDAYPATLFGPVAAEGPAALQVRAGSGAGLMCWPLWCSGRNVLSILWPGPLSSGRAACLQAGLQWGIDAMARSPRHLHSCNRRDGRQTNS
jgi:hypothetical protein